MAASETDTVHTTLFDGGWPDAPLRCLSNETMEAWIAAGRPESGVRPNEGEVIAHYGSGEPILRYAIDEPTADMTGDVLAMVLYAGQGVGLAKEEKPVAEILEEMAAEASQILARLAQD